jgi:diaminopropionate ammonia-lyase
VTERCLVNAAARPRQVPTPSDEAMGFHAALAGYRATPLRRLPALADELGLADVAVKDESQRLGLPAFKVLGASWAAERILRERPDSTTLVAASAGNHGRAVAHVAASRGLRCRIFLPVRSVAARREAIAAEGAEVVVVDGTYEDAVAAAAAAGGRPGCAELADVGGAGPPEWVIDGYATLFGELAAQLDPGGDAVTLTVDSRETVVGRPAEPTTLLVPVGVGSLAAAAARFAARAGMQVIGVEPVTAACLTASLAAGRPAAVATPGTTMAGLDCAEVSPAAWPSLRAGIHATVTVDDAEVRAAVRELARAGLAIGESGAAPLAALRALCADRTCRERLAVGARSRVVLIATEGATDPVSYRAALT